MSSSKEAFTGAFKWVGTNNKENGKPSQSYSEDSTDEIGGTRLPSSRSQQVPHIIESRLVDSRAAATPIDQPIPDANFLAAPRAERNLQGNINNSLTGQGSLHRNSTQYSSIHGSDNHHHHNGSCHTDGHNGRIGQNRQNGNVAAAGDVSIYASTTEVPLNGNDEELATVEQLREAMAKLKTENEQMKALLNLASTAHVSVNEIIGRADPPTQDGPLTLAELIDMKKHDNVSATHILGRVFADRSRIPTIAYLDGSGFPRLGSAVENITATSSIGDAKADVGGSTITNTVSSTDQITDHVTDPGYRFGTATSSSGGNSVNRKKISRISVVNGETVYTHPPPRAPNPPGTPGTKLARRPSTSDFAANPVMYLPGLGCDADLHISNNYENLYGANVRIGAALDPSGPQRNSAARPQVPSASNITLPASSATQSGAPPASRPVHQSPTRVFTAGQTPVNLSALGQPAAEQSGMGQSAWEQTPMRIPAGGQSGVEHAAGQTIRQSTPGYVFAQQSQFSVPPSVPQSQLSATAAEFNAAGHVHQLTIQQQQQQLVFLQQQMFLQQQQMANSAWPTNVSGQPMMGAMPTNMIGMAGMANMANMVNMGNMGPMGGHNPQPGSVPLFGGEQQPTAASSSLSLGADQAQPGLNYRTYLENHAHYDWDVIILKIVQSTDQQASIFLQQKLKTAPTQQRMDLMDAIVAQAYPLMINRFGNFLVQRCFEHGTPGQITSLATTICENALELSTDTFGCHVVQRALDALPNKFKTTIINKLLAAIRGTITDKFACHVWQKLFELRWEKTPPRIMRHVNAALKGEWHEIALGETGSLVVQNIFENCLEEDKRECMDEIFDKFDEVAYGQYGNWCIQHLCEQAQEPDRSTAIDHVIRRAGEYSMHQYAVKIVEKCLKTCESGFVDRYLDRVYETRADSARVSLVDICSDQYGNYLVQYILIQGTPAQKDRVVSYVRRHMVSLRGSKFGARVAMLCGNSNNTRSLHHAPAGSAGVSSRTFPTASTASGTAGTTSCGSSSYHPAAGSYTRPGK